MKIKPKIERPSYAVERVRPFIAKAIDRALWQALEKISFIRENLAVLLKMYNEKEMNETIQDVACKWMNNNASLWKSWLPTDWHKKTELIIGGIFPSTGSFRATGMIPGIQTS